MMLPFYLLIAVMPLVRHQFWSLTSVAGLSMNKWLGLTALITACLYLTMRRAVPRPFLTPQAPIFVAFGVFVILSFLVRGPERIAVELSPVGNWVSFLLLFFMIVVFLDSRRRLKWTLFAAIGGVGFTSLHLLREWQAYGGMRAGVRPGWIAGDPNYFALAALTCLPMAFIFAQVSFPPWQRIAIRTCVVITVLAFVLAASRGGMLGLITSLLVVALRSSRRAQYLTAGGSILVVLLLLAPSSPLLRTLAPGRAEISSTIAHETLLWAGLRMFGDNFLLGVGASNFKRALDRYLGPDDPEIDHVAHNTFLEVGAELGVFGLLMLLAIIVLTFRTLSRVRRAAAHGRDPFLHVVSRGLEASLAGACVSMLFISALHSRLFWFLIIVTMCLPTIPAPAKRRARRRESLGVPVSPDMKTS